MFEELGVLPFAGTGGDFEGFGLVVGVAGGDQGIHDSRQFVRPGGDAFGFAEPPFHAPGVFPHFGLRAVQAEDAQPQGIGHPVGDLPGFGFEDASATDSIVGAQAEPGGEGGAAAE